MGNLDGTAPRAAGSVVSRSRSEPRAGRLARLRTRFASRGADLTRSFARDESGAVWMMTAILSVPMVMAMAVALDTAELYRARENFQQAADAAVLVAATMYSDGAPEAEARDAGKKAFKANLVNLGDSIGEATFTFPADCGTGEIEVAVDGAHPLFFPGIHGLGKAENGGGAKIGVDSAASCPTTTFEVSLVVDTSGSMAWPAAGDSVSKIRTLRSAASNLVEDLFEAGNNVPRPDPVKFAVVPFSAMVNVGASNRNADWMDTRGQSPLHHQDLDWSWDTGIKARKVQKGWKQTGAGAGNWLTRFTLYDWLGVQWAGCVQARPYPYAVEDTEPDRKDPASYFLPAFAVDEPDDYWGRTKYEDDDDAVYCVQFRPKRKKRARTCLRWNDGRRGATHPKGNPTTPVWNQAGYYRGSQYILGQVRDSGEKLWTEDIFVNNYIKDGTNMPSNNECRGNPQHENCANRANQPKRQGFTFKYRNARWWKTEEPGHSQNFLHRAAGPNRNCTARPLLPLSTNERTVKSYIQRLVPTGSTNVAAGTAWGWRTLSSNEPFSEGRDESVRDNRKIMIVMTDGVHTYYRARDYVRGSLKPYISDYNKTIYAGYGYGRHHDGVNSRTNGDGFLFDGFDKYANPGHNHQTWSEAMDARMVETCDNAKATGVTIYSIAFDVPNGSAIKKVLEDCASPPTAGGGQFYYDAKDSAKLTEAFEAISKSIKRLRLTK